MKKIFKININKKGDGLGQVIAALLFLVIVIAMCIKFAGSVGSETYSTLDTGAQSLKDLNSSIKVGTSTPDGH